MIIGCRVVRGPDWQWNNQDGGEGHLGTVVEAKKSSSEGSIWIQWDMGIRNKYRNGHGGKFDIRLYDTTSAGAIHSRITCDACLQEQITGIRWKCVDCLDYDLCHKCYMTDKHNLKHTFKRFDFVNSEGVAVPCRLGAVKLKAYGIVEGAKVERKKDANMKGQVVKVKNIENVRCSGVEVKWDNGLVSTCKVGFEGVVELKCTVEAECGSYYRDHLATVINEKEDKLLDGLKQIQVRDDPGKRKLKGGDKVRVKDLPVSVMEVAQDGHGGWNDEMKKAMGLEGVVIKADPDGDVHVAVGGHMWCFNSDLIEFVQAGNIDDVGMGLLSELYTEAVQNAIGAEGGPKVIAAAAKQGDLPLIKKLLEEHEEWVNHQNSPGELTALQIAAHEGHLEVVDYLIAMQADLNMRDSDGDSALLCAAHKDRPEVIKSLLSCGADANLINNRLQTGIYIAAGKGYHNCVAEFLVEHVLCDPNMQDADGDTPLHVAINKNQDKVIEVMLKSPKVDISVSNGRGFNTLQYAALRGCTKAVELILSQPEGKQLVNSKKKDGFTALHVAAVNDHVEVAKLLIQKGKSDLEIKNNKGATPLMCAVDEFHVKVVGVLVEAGSNVNCTDNDGDTCLHNLMIKNTINDLQGSLSGEDDIMRSLRAVVGGILNTHSESKPDDGFDIAGYLVANGANLQLKNKKGKTALDLNKNPQVEKMLLLVQQQQWQQSLK